MSENLAVMAEHRWCRVIQISDLSEELQPAVGVGCTGGTVEMRVVEEPELEPRVKDFDNEAPDAKEGLVLAAGEVS